MSYASRIMNIYAQAKYSMSDYIGYAECKVIILTLGQSTICSLNILFKNIMKFLAVSTSCYVLKDHYQDDFAQIKNKICIVNWRP